MRSDMARGPRMLDSIHSMAARGKLIVLEGIDGSGKRTQMAMLAQALAQRNVPYAHLSFPRYEGFFGRMVASFLNGEFGPLDSVSPYFSALLYAGDRLEAKPGIESELEQGKVVLADRYIGSNLAHQGSRAGSEERPAFLDWLARLEYEVYALPREDLVVYLRTPVEEAEKLIERKGQRGYTKLRRDLQESSSAHLKTAAQTYDELSRGTNWVSIECFEATKREMLAPEEIHSRVWAAVETRALRAKG